MNTDELKSLGADVKIYTDMGAKFVASLQAHISEELLSVFEISNSSTPHCLRVNIQGFRLTFRVQITLKDTMLNPEIVACRVGDAPQFREEILKSYSFNKLGNVTSPRGTTYDDFSPQFLADVFKNLNSSGIVLRPD